jgi:hypothetical protein
MAMRFSIIKTFKATINGKHEDIVHEVDILKFTDTLKMFVELALLKKKQSRFGTTRWSMDEILAVIDEGLVDTIEDYKKISVKIM